MARERQTQYTKGVDETIESVLQVITIATMTYPRVPTPEELALFMDGALAVKILEAVIRYHEAGSRHIQKTIAEGVQA